MDKKPIDSYNDTATFKKEHINSFGSQEFNLFGKLENAS